MVDKFYSQRHFERVQANENKSKGFNGLMGICLLVLFLAVLGAVGNIDYETSVLEAARPQTASTQVYTPVDIQPAYGIYTFQNATSGWTLQGDLE